MAGYRAQFHRSIQDVPAAHWNALNERGYPFLRHEFLAALERTHCVGGTSGWEPLYLTLSDAAGLAAAAPVFAKSHSYGEFVFDFAWARAYEQSGRRYYPKLTVAAPFTPATGPRLLTRCGPGSAELAGRLLQELEQQCTGRGYSGVHALFLDEGAQQACRERDWLLRRDCQFHWHNRGYADFEHYLAGFTAEKRKKARRERRRVAESGVLFQTRFGHQLDETVLDGIYLLHRDTFARHGHEPYLTRPFFTEIARALPDSFMVKLAVLGETLVAMAVFFVGADTLFGRYWGAADTFHSLHFETCYHQGVEFCIERGLEHFEPGTQGEHKVSRGFEPTLTWSAHYIGDSRFRRAIGEYLQREAGAVQAYADEVSGHVPYRGARSPP